jgi:hypothetical protein
LEIKKKTFLFSTEKEFFGGIHFCPFVRYHLLKRASTKKWLNKSKAKKNLKMSSFVELVMAPMREKAENCRSKLFR